MDSRKKLFIDKHFPQIVKNMEENEWKKDKTRKMFVNEFPNRHEKDVFNFTCFFLRL